MTRSLSDPRHDPAGNVADALPSNVIRLDARRPQHAGPNVVQFPERRTNHLARHSELSVLLGNAIRLLADAKSHDRQVQKLLNRAQALLARLR